MRAQCSRFASGQGPKGSSRSGTPIDLGWTDTNVEALMTFVLYRNRAELGRVPTRSPATDPVFDRPAAGHADEYSYTDGAGISCTTTYAYHVCVLLPGETKPASSNRTSDLTVQGLPAGPSVLTTPAGVGAASIGLP